MHLKTIIILFVILTVLTERGSAQVQTNAQSLIAPTQKTNVADSDATKLAVLENEVQVSKEFMDHMLATVYFSLGTVIVVLFAMVGFGWFQNIRAYERDKEALSQALNIVLNERLAKYATEIDDSVKKDFLTFDSKVGRIFDRLQQDIIDTTIRYKAMSQSANGYGPRKVCDRPESVNVM